MKRYYNKKVCAHWFPIDVTNRPLSRNQHRGVDWVHRWCWDHVGQGRFYLSPYTGVWFESAQDLEEFKKQLAWRLLQS